MSASTTTTNDDLPPLRFMTDEQKEAEFNELFRKVHGHNPPASSDASPSDDLPAYEEELEALTEKLKGHERPDLRSPSSDAPPPPPPPKPLWSKFDHMGGGRFRIAVERGALEHSDQIRLASDRQRLRFAQACEAKCPGCFAEVMDLLDKQAVKQPFKGDPKNDDGCRIIFTRASNFLSESVDWVWKDYVPAASVTILEGDPGVGKSLLLADLAARVSRGLPMPDRSPAFDEPGHDPAPEPGLVWWFSGHDHPEQTLAPRLAAASADMDMIRIAEGVEDQKSGEFRPVRFPQDFLSLWKGRAQSPRLIIVDPLSSFCGGSLNHAANHKALVQLALFARETGAAVIVVRPLNRRFGLSASERGAAGPILLAEARSALLLANHPDDPARRILAVVKSNLCAPAASHELSIEPTILPPCGGGGELASRWGVPSDNRGANSSIPSLATDNSQLATPLITWHGRSPLLADELLRTRTGASARSPFEQKKVEEWLTEKLAAGPKPVKEINAQAALDEIPPVLLRRAQISMNILPSGSNGSTTWQLPKAESPSPLVGEGLGVRGTSEPRCAASQIVSPPPQHRRPRQTRKRNAAENDSSTLRRTRNARRNR